MSQLFQYSKENIIGITSIVLIIILFVVNQNLKEDVKILRSTIYSLENRIGDDYSYGNDNLNSRLDDLEYQISDLESEIQNLQYETQNLEAQIMNLQFQMW